MDWEQKLDKIFDLLKSKLMRGGYSAPLWDDTIKIIVPDYRFEWRFFIESGRCSAEKIPRSDDDDRFQTVVEAEKQVLIDLFGRCFLSFSYIGECVAKGRIRIRKETNGVVNIHSMFLTYPYRDMSAEFEKDGQFDSRHAARTADVVEANGAFDSDYSREHFAAYVPTPSFAWDDLFKNLDIDFSQYQFIDIGCGMGRTVLAANAFPFKAKIGVEYSKVLYDVAVANLAAQDAACRENTHIVNADARTYQYAKTNTLLYLYEPFDEMIYGEWLASLKQQLYGVGVDLVIVLLGDRLRRYSDNVDWLQLEKAVSLNPKPYAEKSGWLLFPEEADRVAEGRFDYAIYRPRYPRAAAHDTTV